ATLHRAVPLTQMDHLALAVAEHLHLDVPAAGNVAFQIDARVTESRTRLGRCQLHGGRQILEALDELHSPSATPAYRFDQQGGTDPAPFQHRRADRFHRG